MSNVHSLLLSSKNRNSGSLSNPHFNLDEPLHDLQGYKIRQLMIPLSTSVIDSRNNKIHFQEGTGGSLLTATLSSGNFNGISLASNLQSALSDTGSTSYNVSYSTQTNLMVINNGTAGVFAFSSGNYSCLYETGLDSQIGLFQTSFTTSNVDCSGLKMIHILSNYGGVKLNGINNRLLGSIITEESNLSVSSFVNDSDNYVVANSKELSNLELSFKDDQWRDLTIDKDYFVELNFTSG